MKILILGAGQVGTSVVSHLVSEANDIIVVDTQANLLEELQNRFDVGTVVGHAAHPAVLEQAGATHTDMLIAVTSDDETNMLACKIAHDLFSVPRKIARVRALEYIQYPALFGEDAIPIDKVISPEQIVTEVIERLLKYPGATQVMDFADGRVRMVSVRAVEGSPLVGRPIKELNEHMPNAHARITAIFRAGEAIVPRGSTVIEPGDEVFFAASTEEIAAVMIELCHREEPYRRLMFAGGGHIGKRVARRLEKDYQVKVIERDRRRARKIAAELSRTVILQGDATDEALLTSENISDVDVFCAITNSDEANILSAMLAKRMGARRVMSLINRPTYADLMVAHLDQVISPREATIGALLRYVRRGDVVQVHSLRGGTAEAIEAVAHGNPRTSQVVGQRIDRIPIPPGVIMGALVRGEEVIKLHHDTVIEEGDHIIMFLLSKQLIPQMEKLFAVGT